MYEPISHTLFKLTSLIAAPGGSAEPLLCHGCLKASVYDDHLAVYIVGGGAAKKHDRAHEVEGVAPAAAGRGELPRDPGGTGVTKGQAARF